jgi:hypothetical protein
MGEIWEITEKLGEIATGTYILDWDRANGRKIIRK